ncbi:MAG: hypothetical protein ACFFE8_02115 [Candidatus Heimdallarchaeota archaeon]
MGVEVRKKVFSRIRRYLNSNPSDLQGVQSLREANGVKDRVDAVIRRLDEFSPIETLNWNLEDRKLYRESAIAAGIHFIRQYPMMFHTPNSLRACFGMPTRADRKKGRYSSIFLRNEAIDRQLRPKIPDLEDLKKILQKQSRNGKFHEVSAIEAHLERIMKRDYQEEEIQKPISDHHPKSIEHLKLFLTEFGFEDLQEHSEVEDEEDLQNDDGVLLAPDLIGRFQGKECWIELKEYREHRFNSKVLFQVFRYLQQNSLVFLVTTSDLPSFTQLLDQQNWTRKALKSWGRQQQNRLNSEFSTWNSKQTKFYDYGTSLNLTPRLEAIYLTIVGEVIKEELGVLGTEINGIQKFLKILSLLPQEIKVFNFDDILRDGRELASTSTILIKMDYISPKHSPKEGS